MNLNIQTLHDKISLGKTGINLKMQTVESKTSIVKSEVIYELERRKYARNLPTITPADHSIVDAIKREGVFVTSLENLLIKSTVQLMYAATNLASKLPATVPNNVFDTEYINRNAVEASPLQIITQYPDIFLWGVEERLLNLAENYLGLPVAYHGVNFRRDVASDKPLGTRLWHTDGDDIRMLKIIIYLNDVSENGGPFEYMPKPRIPSSQLLWYAYLKLRFMKKGASAFSDEQIKKILPKSTWKSCLGSIGTVIFVDPRSVFHHGKMPSSDRLALFFLYTSRHPRRPEISKHSFNFKPDQLLGLTKQLSQRQMECIFYNQKF